MNVPRTPEERAAYYREQAVVADNATTAAGSDIMAKSFEKLARDWRDLADSAEKLHL